MPASLPPMTTRCIGDDLSLEVKVVDTLGGTV